MLKITIIGPESTGKTKLAQALASHFDAVWEPELARAYIENLNRAYTCEDVCEIARQQIEIEKRYEQNNTAYQIVFFDTDLVITKVWLMYKYHLVPQFITQRLNKKFTNLYLLCEPDIPWKPDTVREHGHNRDFFFDWYKKEIEHLNIPYVIIYGTGKKRLENAVEKVQAFILDNP